MKEANTSDVKSFMRHVDKSVCAMIRENKPYNLGIRLNGKHVSLELNAELYDSLMYLLDTNLEEAK